MPSGTFTVDGFAGAGIAFQAKVYSNITRFEVNIDDALLKLTDVDGKVINLSISTAVTWTVTLSAALGNYTVTIAD